MQQHGLRSGSANKDRKVVQMIVRCEINLYSGRANPSWELTEKQRIDLFARLATLPEASPGKRNEQLGYRGIHLAVNGDEANAVQSIDVHDGAVRTLTRGGKERWYLDQDRALERTLLQSGKGSMDSATYSYIADELGPAR